MMLIPSAFASVPVQAAEVFKTVLSDMVAHRYTPFSRDSCSIVYEVSPHTLLSLCQRDEDLCLLLMGTLVTYLTTASRPQMCRKFRHPGTH